MSERKVVLSTEPNWFGLGDTIWFLPTVKRLSLTFKQKISIVTQYPQLFKNNPYVGDIFSLKDFDFSSQAANPFCFRPLNGANPFWFGINIKQYIANKCGFSLLPEEEEIFFFREKPIKRELPKDYVLINASKRGVDRDLGQEGWQKIVDILNKKDIPVVVEGPTQHTYDLQINNGLNLRGAVDSISESWHLINDSFCYLTFDTGMYILAGTTEAQIFLVNSYFENHWHKPYRNNSYDYKLSVIEGRCIEKCLGNLKYYVTPNGLSQFRVQTCPLNINFRCIPSPETISERIINYYVSRKSNKAQ
jgi:ADP-heptose:LPS heptosyltransferase